jgi:hypothetical protein
MKIVGWILVEGKLGYCFGQMESTLAKRSTTCPRATVFLILCKTCVVSSTSKTFEILVKKRHLKLT